MEHTTSKQDLHTIIDIVLDNKVKESKQDCLENNIPNKDHVNETEVGSNDLQIKIQDRTTEIINEIIHDSIYESRRQDNRCNEKFKLILFIICAISAVIAMLIIYL